MKIKKQLLPLCIFLVTMSLSCRVTFVPEYSSEIETQIVNGAKMNDKLYIDLLSAEDSKRTFQLFTEKYSQVEAEINSIRLKNETRKKAVEMLTIIDKLNVAFKQYRDEHKAKTTPLTNGEIISYQSQIKAFWKPLLIAEGGLKKAKG